MLLLIYPLFFSQVSSSGFLLLATKKVSDGLTSGWSTCRKEGGVVWISCMAECREGQHWELVPCATSKPGAGVMGDHESLLLSLDVTSFDQLSLNVKRPCSKRTLV